MVRLETANFEPQAQRTSGSHTGEKYAGVDHQYATFFLILPADNLALTEYLHSKRKRCEVAVLEDGLSALKTRFLLETHKEKKISD